MQCLIRIFAFAALGLSAACTDKVSASSSACPAQLDCSKDFRRLRDIQGSGASSPLAGERVTTTGVVSAVVPAMAGFFMQEPGPRDTSASQGIFVYMPHPEDNSPALKVGDQVALSGEVSEYHGMTELTHPRELRVLASGLDVKPISLRLPLPEGQTLENYEGMLVRIESPMIVAQNYFLARYGQMTLSAIERAQAPTIANRPNSPAALQAALAIERGRLVLDDASSKQSPQPTPYMEPDSITRAGDQVSELQGVIDEGLISADKDGPVAYRLQPTSPPVISHTNPRPEVPPAVPGGLHVASMNVLNFFTTFKQAGAQCAPSGTSDDCRGAHNLAEFERQRNKIVAALQALNADVVALMELENHGDAAVQALVDALNAQAGANTYAVVPIASDQTGTDAIRVGLIYKPATLKLAGPALADPDPIHSRAPLAQTFITPGGRTFSVVAVHFKSKRCDEAGGDNADAGDGQACYNGKRVQQAQKLLAFIERVKQAAHDDKVLVVGDFNANPMEDPMVKLKDGGLLNEIQQRIAHPYSFVFNGESLCIDQALATPTMDKLVAGVAEWHINADESALFDYTMAFKAKRFYAPTPFRSSDHDPLVVGLNLS